MSVEGFDADESLPRTARYGSVVVTGDGAVGRGQEDDEIKARRSCVNASKFIRIREMRKKYCIYCALV